jgi:sarcosine oxidase delta subunit
MVIIECPHCDKQVSNLAVKCPHCGKTITHSKLPAGQPFARPSGLAGIKRLVWLILLLALLAAGVYYGLPLLGIKIFR